MFEEDISSCRFYYNEFTPFKEVKQESISIKHISNGYILNIYLF